jgi:hypothetical protein
MYFADLSAFFDVARFLNRQTCPYLAMARALLY